MLDPVFVPRQRVAHFARRPEAIASGIIWKDDRDIFVLGIGLNLAHDGGNATCREHFAPCAELLAPANTGDGFNARGEPVAPNGAQPESAYRNPNVRRHSLSGDRLIPGEEGVLLQPSSASSLDELVDAGVAAWERSGELKYHCGCEENHSLRSLGF